MQISSVAEYRDFVERHNLPLDQMRFALERKTEDRWFYLYYDHDTAEWIVAKNKDDGTTFIKYRGPDQATACQILFDKMEEEAKKRGYLGGFEDARMSEFEARWCKIEKPLTVFVTLIVIVALVGVPILIALLTMNDGYYVDRETGEVIYYMDGDTYAYDTTTEDWYPIDDPEEMNWHDYEDYYEYYDDDNFESSTGSQYMGSGSDWSFSDTSYYEDYHSSSSDSDWDSDDYSSWDSGDTDWGSDW